MTPRNHSTPRTAGAVQALPNGSLLVTESNKGRIFELTRGGEKVWEFLNPDIDTEKNTRGAIYRMTRIDAEIAAQLPLTR